MLQSMGLQIVRHDWATKLNWCSLILKWACTSIPFALNFLSSPDINLLRLQLGVLETYPQAIPFSEPHSEYAQSTYHSLWFVFVSLLCLFLIYEWVSEVAQLCPTLCDPVDCSPPGSSVHGILQARILEWVAISFSRVLIYGDSIQC